MLLLGILKKGPDPARTFKKRTNQNISGPHTHLMQNTLSISCFSKTLLKFKKFIIIDFFLFSLVEIKNHEPLALVNVDHNSSVFINFSILLCSPCVATWSKVKVFKTKKPWSSSWLVQLIEGCNLRQDRLERIPSGARSTLICANATKFAGFPQSRALEAALKNIYIRHLLNIILCH